MLPAPQGKAGPCHVGPRPAGGNDLGSAIAGIARHQALMYRADEVVILPVVEAYPDGFTERRREEFDEARRPGRIFAIPVEGQGYVLASVVVTVFGRDP